MSGIDGPPLPSRNPYHLPSPPPSRPPQVASFPYCPTASTAAPHPFPGSRGRTRPPPHPDPRSHRPTPLKVSGRTLTVEVGGRKTGTAELFIGMGGLEAGLVALARPRGQAVRVGVPDAHQTPYHLARPGDDFPVVLRRVGMGGTSGAPSGAGTACSRDTAGGVPRGARPWTIPPHTRFFSLRVNGSGKPVPPTPAATWVRVTAPGAVWVGELGVRGTSPPPFLRGQPLKVTPDPARSLPGSPVPPPYVPRKVPALHPRPAHPPALQGAWALRHHPHPLAHAQ